MHGVSQELLSILQDEPPTYLLNSSIEQTTNGEGTGRFVFLFCFCFFFFFWEIKSSYAFPLQKGSESGHFSAITLIILLAHSNNVLLWILLIVSAGDFKKLFFSAQDALENWSWIKGKGTGHNWEAVSSKFCSSAKFPGFCLVLFISFFYLGRNPLRWQSQCPGWFVLVSWLWKMVSKPSQGWHSGCSFLPLAICPVAIGSW